MRLKNFTEKIKNKEIGVYSFGARVALEDKKEELFVKNLLAQFLDPATKQFTIEVIGEELAKELEEIQDEFLCIEKCSVYPNCYPCPNWIGEMEK